MTDRFWELMARRWSGEITREEQAELEQYLLEHPEYWLKAGLSEQLSYKAAPSLSAAEEERLADNIQERIQQEALADVTPVQMLHGRASRLRAAGLVLAVLAGALLCWGAWQFWLPGTPSSWKHVSTVPGTKTSITLADGTTIRLNAGSALRYPETFSRQDKVREVFLEGEGYFEVQHDASRPFVIHVADMDIRVLGTALNVRAYPDEQFSETTLVQGAVEVAVRAKDSARRFLLKPGQKVVVADNAPAGKSTVAAPDTLQERITLQTISPASDSVIAETAWKEDKLVFHDETFAALAQRLERWYGVQIVINDPALAAKRFTGRADNVSLIQLLDILQAITPFEASMQDGIVMIQNRGQ